MDCLNDAQFMLKRRQKPMSFARHRRMVKEAGNRSAQGESALNPILEHLAGREGGHALGGNFDLFAGLGVETLPGRALTGLKRTKSKDGNFFAFHHGINDGFDGGVHHLGHIGFGQLGASGNQVDEVSFVLGVGRTLMG